MGTLQMYKSNLKENWFKSETKVGPKWNIGGQSDADIEPDLDTRGINIATNEGKIHVSPESGD